MSRHVTVKEMLPPKVNRQVAAATLVGTTVEWYDFFIYSNAAALVLGPLFFAPAEKAGMAQVISFATLGIAFFFRPLGAIIAGHLGDRIGRKSMLVLTLVCMGVATTLIGVLPTYAAIGVWAPILLILLRVLQGLSAGGEWGGAALMAVEHAPTQWRGRYGAFPQMGVPAGMLAATIVLAIIQAFTTEEQFLAWGWRIPFLISVLLIAIGYYVRRKVTESPVFQEIEQQSERTKMPLAELLKGDKKQVLQGAIIFAGNNVCGYMIVGGFVLSYATKTLGLDQLAVTLVVGVAAAAWILTTGWGGIISDRIRRVPTYQIGFVALAVWVFPMFWLMSQGNIWLVLVAVVVLSVGLGLSYGPQAALFSEMYPATYRYSGASLSYALGAILGGFAPMISEWLRSATNSIYSVPTFLLVVVLIAFAVTFTIKDRTGRPLTDKPDAPAGMDGSDEPAPSGLGSPYGPGEDG